MSTQRSAAWYILPVLFGLVGSVISWAAIRKDDPTKARNCWIIGLVLTILSLVIITVAGI